MTKFSALPKEAIQETEIDLEESAVKEEVKNTSKSPVLSQEEFELTVLAHREFGMKLAWSFLGNWRVRMRQDEVESSVGVALVDAGRRFDPSRGVSFRTFFFYYLRGTLLKEISRIINDQKLCKLVPEYAGPMNQDSEGFVSPQWRQTLIERENPESIFHRRQKAMLCWEACKELDPLEQEVVIRSFVHDQSLVDIAKELDYCRCHISRVKSNALTKLRGTLEKYSVETPKKASAKLAPKKQSKKRSLRKNKKSGRYTGGRGRRRKSEKEFESKSLDKILAIYGNQSK